MFGICYLENDCNISSWKITESDLGELETKLSYSRVDSEGRFWYIEFGSFATIIEFPMFGKVYAEPDVSKYLRLVFQVFWHISNLLTPYKIKQNHEIHKKTFDSYKAPHNNVFTEHKVRTRRIKFVAFHCDAI